jgi:hypothetical protein
MDLVKEHVVSQPGWKRWGVRHVIERAVLTVGSRWVIFW